MCNLTQSKAIVLFKKNNSVQKIFFQNFENFSKFYPEIDCKICVIRNFFAENFSKSSQKSTLKFGYEANIFFKFAKKNLKIPRNYVQLKNYAKKKKLY